MAEKPYQILYMVPILSGEKARENSAETLFVWVWITERHMLSVEPEGVVGR